jgi:magnesium-transporting ATPase (P-type)
MKRRGLQLSRGHKFMIYAVSLALFLSGVFWAWIQHLDEAGKAGEGLRQAKTWLIEIHGFSAMVFVLLFGTLLASHVRRAWHARKNRNNGVFFLTSVGLLTLSGYALYYVGNENWRNTVSDFHLWLGIAAPTFLFWHIWFGRRATRN